MRKSQITAVIQCPINKEAALLQTIVDFLQTQKTQGNVDKADVETVEIEIPTKVTI